MNKAVLVKFESEACPVVDDKQRIMESYSSYLTDESKSSWEVVDALYFPANTAQVVDAVKCIRARGGRIVVSGSRTGITGGATGLAGASIISLEKMTARLGEKRFQAGVRLENLPEFDSWYYPVDPTEMTASIGGTVATNASGSRTFYYGSTRKHISAITVVLADGRVLNVKRGEVFCENGRFVFGGSGREIIVPVEPVRMPPVKHTAGYYLKPGMDLIDLFIGSEGTLGIITEIEIKLAPFPGDRLFLVVYLGEEEQALNFVERLKGAKTLHPLAIEYFDPSSIDLLRASGKNVAGLPAKAKCAIYSELLMDQEDIEKDLEVLLKSCGLGMDATWAGFDDADLAAMKLFRHSVPESINSIIGNRKKDMPALHKIGTDTAVPEGKLREFLSGVRGMIESRNLQYAVFGHIGDNHLHINMMPSDMEKLEDAKQIYVKIAELSVKLGGSVSSEHGVGRLKKQFLEIQFNDKEMAAMKAVKDALDPDGVLNPGVMF